MTIEDLVERVRGLTGPDRETDLAIHCALFPDSEITKIATGVWNDQRDWGVTHGSIWNRTEFGGASIPLPRLTASIDAALDLAERELPVWEVAMGTCGQNNCPWACLTAPQEPYRDIAADAPTIELALVEAILTAIQSSEQSDAALSNSERTDG